MAGKRLANPACPLRVDGAGAVTPTFSAILKRSVYLSEIFECIFFKLSNQVKELFRLKEKRETGF